MSEILKIKFHTLLFFNENFFLNFGARFFEQIGNLRFFLILIIIG